MEKVDKSRVALSLRQSQPLARQLLWPKTTQVMLDGYSKQDPPTWEMLLVEADVPALLVEIGYGKRARHMQRPLEIWC
jgi:hypothetical protein